ncbi:MAG: type IVB secretion system protein DotA [Gammaproteobacteria bacterium]
MISLFQIAPQDQSVFYLGQIFGMVGTILPVSNPSLLMGMMFKFLNTAALTIGALLVVYVIVVGLLKTAQEGEFLGKQWNSLWVPLRTVFGIACLFPTATGYSIIQIIIMWIILQGVGAADTLWTNVLNYITVTGSPYAAVSSGSMPSSTQLSPTMQQLFQSLMCQASAKATYSSVNLSPAHDNTVGYFCGSDQDNTSDPFCVNPESQMLNAITGPQAGDNKYSMGPGASGGTGGVCGSLTYCDAEAACVAPTGTSPDGSPPTTGPDTIGCLSCKAQHSAIQQIIPTLGAVADKLVYLDNQYMQFYYLPVTSSPPSWIQDYCTAKGIPSNQCCNVVKKIGGFPVNVCTTEFNKLDAVGSDNDLMNASSDTAKNLYLQYPLKAYLSGSDFINASVLEYQANLVSAVSADIEKKMKNVTLTGWQAAAAQQGWMFAGSFFYKMAGQNQTMQSSVNNLVFKVTSPQGMKVPAGNLMNSYRNNYTAVGAMLSEMTTANSNSPYSMPPEMGDVSNALGSSAGVILQLFKICITAGSDTNPIIAIANFGYGLMIAAQVLFAIIVLLVAILTATTSIMPMVLGTGITMNPAGEAVKAVVALLAPFFVVLILGIYSLGAILGIYIPLIPYVLFTMGAIGWILACVEAMVAAPIIALGILSPGGQHDILGRAEPALMMMFNLFLRPILMVFGLMAAMLVSMVVINLVNSTFYGVTTTILSNPGLFEQLLFIAAYTSLIVTVINKAFSLIYVIPERILTWIGGPAVQYGEQEALGAGKQAIEAAAGAAAGAGKESAGTAGTGVEKYKMAGKEKAKRAEDEAAKLALANDAAAAKKDKGT